MRSLCYNTYRGRVSIPFHPSPLTVLPLTHIIGFSAIRVYALSNSWICMVLILLLSAAPIVAALVRPHPQTSPRARREC